MVSIDSVVSSNNAIAISRNPTQEFVLPTCVEKLLSKTYVAALVDNPMQGIVPLSMGSQGSRFSPFTLGDSTLAIDEGSQNCKWT